MAASRARGRYDDLYDDPPHHRSGGYGGDYGGGGGGGLNLYGFDPLTLGAHAPSVTQTLSEQGSVRGDLTPCLSVAGGNPLLSHRQCRHNDPTELCSC